jgi:transposase-like protein
MAEFARKANGRRVFTVDFKRETVARIVSGEKTLAELSRELGISPSVLRNWMRLVERGGTTAVAAGEDVVPARRAASIGVLKTPRFLYQILSVTKKRASHGYRRTHRNHQTSPV